MTRLIDMSPFGLRFTLTQPTEPGRLLHLRLPMPRQLRSFDHDEEQYRVWALVRHIKPLSSTDERLPHFVVGVALVGKHPPKTFEIDVTRRYDIASSSTENSAWSLQEQDDLSTGPAASDRRAEVRHNIAIDVVLEIYDAQGRVFASEITRTENISQRGMAVLTTLNIARGRYIRVRSAHYKIAVIAAVRRLRRDTDGMKRLHLEFIDQQWPPIAG